MDPRTIVLFTTDARDRATARAICETETHEIEEFESAEAALASLRDDPCAVALVDLDAPGAAEMLGSLRTAGGKARMPILGAARRERPELRSLCDHVEVGARPFLAIAVELALALEEAEAVRSGLEVRTARDATSIGVVRAVTGDSVVVHLFGAGRRTIPLSAVSRVEGDAVVIDAAALSGEIGEALFREDDELERRVHRRYLDAPDRSAMRSLRGSDRSKLASHRRHPRNRPQAIASFAASLAQRWAVR